MDKQSMISSDSEFQWQNIDGSPRCIQKVLEERRLELLEAIPTNPCTDEDKQLLKEWLVLVKERDAIFNKIHDKENTEKLDTHITELWSILEHIGRLNHRQTRTSLRDSLQSIHHEVHEYMKEKRIVDPASHSHIRGQTSTADSLVESIPCVPPPPPPPPPITTPLQPFKLNSTKLKSCLKLDNDSCDDKTINISEVPTFLEFQRHVLKEQRTHLKKTPGMRSPGGTPRVKVRRLDPSNDGDLVSRALRKKFRNIKMKSPMTPTSPKYDNSAADGSFTLSID